MPLFVKVASWSLEPSERTNEMTHTTGFAESRAARSDRFARGCVRDELRISAVGGGWRREGGRPWGRGTRQAAADFRGLHATRPACYHRALRLSPTFSSAHVGPCDACLVSNSGNSSNTTGSSNGLPPPELTFLSSREFPPLRSKVLGRARVKVKFASRRYPMICPPLRYHAGSRRASRRRAGVGGCARGGREGAI